MPEVRSRYVEVCIFRFLGDRPEFLMLRRAPGQRLYPGLWQFVTGKVRPGESATDAARRELAEETGLVPLRFWVVPHCSTFYDAAADAVEIVPLFAAQVDAGASPRLSEEHAGHLWLAPGPARRRLVWPGQKEGLDRVLAAVIDGEEAGRLSRLG